MFRKYGGKLLMVAAGGGCLALVFFVVAPKLFEPAPSMPQDEIVAEAMGTDERQADARKIDEGRESEAVTPVYSPLVGVRNDGLEVEVIFPAAEPGAGVSRAAAEEIAEEESGLPQALSAADVAEARAALAVREPERVETVELGATTGIEEEVAVAAVEDGVAVAVAPPVAETAGAVEAERAELDSTAGGEDEAPLSALPARDAEAVEKESEAVATNQDMAVERVSAGDDARLGNASRLAERRGEFDMPVWADSRAPLEVSHPSGRVPDDATARATRAGERQPGQAPRKVEVGFVVPGTLRGVMGYRMPLISRQEVPDQIVSGVLIPAHTTFVILKEGSWELVDVTPEEQERFREAVAKRETPALEVGTVRRGWNPLRVFRKRKAPGAQQIDVGQKKR